MKNNMTQGFILERPEQCLGVRAATDLLRVHSIETFGAHDGPGLRLVVFVQGCQLRCLYCANPDTLAIGGGKLMPLEKLVEMAIDEKPYFGKKGGVTVSGGEPTLQAPEVKALFERLHEEGINTALDSNGSVLNRAVKELLEETDLLLLDVKHFNDEWHHKLTGRSNRNVFKVAEHRESTGKPMWLRYVLVPGYTDQEEYLHQLGQHFQHYQTIERIEIKPYHRLGEHKWTALGMTYALEGVESPSAAALQKASDIFKLYFKEVKVN